MDFFVLPVVGQAHNNNLTLYTDGTRCRKFVLGGENLP